jgi:hypothetical protein
MKIPVLSAFLTISIKFFVSWNGCDFTGWFGLSVGV